MPVIQKPKYELFDIINESYTREELRDIAKKIGVRIGRNKHDTINYILWHERVIPRIQLTFIDEDNRIIIL